MKHIRDALPRTANDALRLPDLTSFMDFWTRVSFYLAAEGEPPATWREIQPLFGKGWGVEAAAHEIADRRVPQ